MTQYTINEKLALEMAMQDVLGNMEEMALDFGYGFGEACFEILAIEPAEIPHKTVRSCPRLNIRSPFSAEVCPLASPRRVA